jgi:hypothetical protein
MEQKRQHLRLRKETLVELTADELAIVAAGKPVSEGAGCRPFTDLSRCCVATLPVTGCLV